MTIPAPTKPSLGDLLLGTEGLALLRLAFTGDASGRDARIAEIRELLDKIDDLEFAAPIPALEYDVATGYEHWSKTYDAPLRLFFIEQPCMHALFDAMPSGTVLDAACGTGRHSVALAQRGHTVMGVDSSPAMLAKAREKFPQCDFRAGDLTDLPVPSGSVEAVVCALALVHLPALDQAIIELARVVRPGGRVIISDVHPLLIQLGWQAQFQMADGSAGFMRLHVHTLSDYARCFAAAGLRIRTLYEPALTEQSAITVATERLPDANHDAWVGLPGVVVWDLEKP